MIDLYTWKTPNGRKVSIALEEMALSYEVQVIDTGAGEQFAPAYLAINPNAKIPAIIDHDTGARIFESGAILTYLAEKSGQFLPERQPNRAVVLAWLHWQTAGLGPTLGQLNYFLNRADQQMPEAINRFLTETVRLLGVLDHQLSKDEFIAGSYSIADIATYPWLEAAYDAVKAKSGTTFPQIERWLIAMAAREGIARGMLVP